VSAVLCESRPSFLSRHYPNTQPKIIVNAQPTNSGETSVAAPLWAALTGLLNDARLRTGKPTMGFLNPWLYAHSKDFLTDVTGGKTRVCDGTNHQTGKKLWNSGKMEARAGTTPGDGIRRLG
jgi:tripeptidyl-peptidase-1